MLKNKNASQLSMNTMTIAIIALVVLIVSIAIFTGKAGSFSKGSNEATSCTQMCGFRGYTEGTAKEEGANPPSGYNELFGVKDSDGKQCFCRN